MMTSKLSRAALMLAAAAVTVPLSPTARAADYYFDATRATNGSGTSASPFNTLAPFNALDLNGGDHVYLSGSFTAPTGGLQLASDDAGTSLSPVTITSLNPSAAAVINAGNGFGLNAVNVGGLSLSHLDFVGSGPGSIDDTGLYTNTGDGIRFYANQGVKQNFVRISDVVADGFGENGIHFQADNGQSGFSDVQISHSTARNNQRAGVNFEGDFNQANRSAHTNVRIDHVAAYNNSGRANRPGEGNSGSGIVIGQVDDGVIERSVAYNNGFACQSTQGGPVGIWAWDSNNVRIQFNESFNNHTGGQYDGGGFDLDGGVTNSVMQYNYSHENDGAGYLLAEFTGAKDFNGNTVRYNISQNDGRKNGYGGIHAFGTIGPTDVYNNTVYMAGVVGGSKGDADSPVAVKLRSGTKQVRLFNNIFIVSDVAGENLTYVPDAIDLSEGPAGFLFRRNDYFSTDGTTVSNALDAEALHVDPKLFDAGGGGTLMNADQLATLTAYLLSNDSFLVDAGLDLRGLYGIDVGSQDYYGVGLHGLGPDIGASENPQGPTYVPEPTGLAMLAAGAVGMAGRRRRGRAGRA